MELYASSTARSTPTRPIGGVVAGKARVHEMAKELGRTSKEIMIELRRTGVTVMSPSSLIDAPVVRQLRDRFAAGGSSKPLFRPEDRNYLLPPSRVDADETARRAAAEAFGVDPDSIRLRGEPRGRQRRNRNANSTGGASRQPGQVHRSAPSAHRSSSINPQAALAAREFKADGDWAQHLLDPDDRRRWQDAGLRPYESNLAARCIEYRITPDMLSLRLSGVTLLERLRSGESIASVWARLQEATEAPTWSAEHRRQGTG